jgi:hypothetical protein
MTEPLRLRHLPFVRGGFLCVRLFWVLDALVLTEAGVVHQTFTVISLSLS